MNTNQQTTLRILSNEPDTHYVELSTQYDSDVYLHASVIRFLTFLMTSLNAYWLIMDAGAAICPTFR